jgi:primosomal protein N' (replication factor Y)
VIARVAVFLPVPKAFDYSVPAEMSVAVGSRVWTPWGRRSVEGVVVALDPPDAPQAVRPIARLVDAPPIAPDLMSLATWMAEYYLAPLGEVLRLMLPAGGRAKARRTALLSDAGRAAAESMAGALEPVALAELGAKERAVLSALAAGARDADEIEDYTSLQRLIDRGLATVGEEVRTEKAREEIVLRTVRQIAAGELARSPRQRQLYERIAAGEVTLAQLRGEDARAPDAAVAALVEAGLVAEERRPIARDPFAAFEAQHATPPVLTEAQAAAMARIEPAIRNNGYAPFVLHGVTGSGKTEIYLRTIAVAKGLGKRALVLVPEISLTPQLAARFRGRFGAAVAVLHSGLTDAERKDAHRRIAAGEVSIALGARSAVFAPLAQLGVVIVDEEHDSSFKQEEGVRYNGRDVALVRARAAGAVALLGSATPSLETIAAAREGRLGLIELPERATARALPTVEIVDLRRHKLGDGLFAAPLAAALQATVAAGEQAILFLNRRGFSTFLLCKSCGQGLRCRDCSVTLTYHLAGHQLVCHYCGFHTPPPRACPSCGQTAIERLGFGTEQVETRVRALLPTARVARLDRDTAQGAGLGKILDGLRRHELDVVVGTQMITKGHDFPGVTLVGVVLADLGMSLPDFRASERTFQLLVQVAGRAGRGDKPGRVIVQTFSPQHPAVTCARDHDYARFVEAELAARVEPAFPPTVRLACVRVDGGDPLAVRDVAEAAADAARRVAKQAPADAHADVLGPTEAPLGRLKGRTRWQLFVRAKSARVLRVIARAAAEVAAPRAVRVTVDVDPVSML